MCTSPGVMTPTELQEALADGVSHNKFATTIHQGWADRLKMHIDDVKCIAPKSVNGKCIFFTDDGKCELHGKPYKPFECKSAIHVPQIRNFADKAIVEIRWKMMDSKMIDIFYEWRKQFKLADSGKD